MQDKKELSLEVSSKWKVEDFFTINIVEKKGGGADLSIIPTKEGTIFLAHQEQKYGISPDEYVKKMLKEVMRKIDPNHDPKKLKFSVKEVKEKDDKQIPKRSKTKKKK